jgi:epoxide hydrolase
VEKFKAWTAPGKDLPEGAVDRDRMLTNITLYWLTGSAGTSANIYYEASHAGEWDFPTPSGIPTGVAIFGPDVAIRRFAERSNVVTHWAEYEEGGHFAAMETPNLLVDDLRAFFRTLR